MVADVYAPPGIATRIVGGEVTVERGDQPMVVPFRVEDADGGAATGLAVRARRPTPACPSWSRTP